jgi:hypothetical protein
MKGFEDACLALRQLRETPMDELRDIGGLRAESRVDRGQRVLGGGSA